jgi:hypothetical protein
VWPGRATAGRTITAEHAKYTERFSVFRVVRGQKNLLSNSTSYFYLQRPLAPNEKGQRREPAADDVGFVSEPLGWLPFAGPSGSPFVAVAFFLRRSSFSWKRFPCSRSLTIKRPESTTAIPPARRYRRGPKHKGSTAKGAMTAYHGQ